MTLSFILKGDNLTARFYENNTSQYRATGFKVNKPYWIKNKRALDNPAANNLITDWQNKFADYLYHCNKNSLTPNLVDAIEVVCAGKKLSGFTLYDAVNGFIKSVSSTHKAATIKKYTELKELDDIALNKITGAYYASVSDKLLESGNANYTVKRKLGFLTTVLLYAKRSGMVINLPEQDKVMLKNSEAVRFPLEESELQVLRNFRKDICLDAFLFACETGLRLSDILAITPVCVIKDGSYINFNMVKGGVKRPNIVLSDYAAEILSRYKTDLTAPYFKNLPVDINVKLKAIFKEAGLSRLCEVVRNYGNEVKKDIKPLHELAHFHMGRNTAATLLIERGQPLIYVKEMLGHSKIETTMRYVRVSNKVAMDSLRLALNQVVNL